MLYPGALNRLLAALIVAASALPAAASGPEALPELPALSFSTLPRDAEPAAIDAVDAEPESVCVLPIRSVAQGPSDSCRARLASARPAVAALPGQDGLLTMLDAVLGGSWPANEGACESLARRAESADLLREMPAAEVAGSICRENGLPCVEVRRSGEVASGCGAQAIAAPVSSFAAGAEPAAQAAVAATQPPYSRAFRISEGYAWGGLAFDLATTARAISLGGREVGIYRVVGNRNTAGIVLFAAGFEAVMTLMTRRSYRQGHTKLAATMNFLRGSMHLGAGAHNLNVIRQMSR